MVVTHQRKEYPRDIQWQKALRIPEKKNRRWFRNLSNIVFIIDFDCRAFYFLKKKDENRKKIVPELEIEGKRSRLVDTT